jgi:hypothetical protein
MITRRLKLQIALWTASVALVSFAAGVYAASVFIGDFIGR